MKHILNNHLIPAVTIAVLIAVAVISVSNPFVRAAALAPNSTLNPAGAPGVDFVKFVPGTTGAIPFNDGDDSVFGTDAALTWDGTKFITSGFKLTGGSPGSGKVLTSDATGIGTWETASSGWSLLGNAGTVDGTDFIGTTDTSPLNFRVNSQPSGRIEPVSSTYNTFFGYQSGVSTTSGTHNVAFGFRPLYNNIAGSYNTALGDSALYTNNGYNNTAVGFSALNLNTTGGSNTASGNNSLYSNTTGSNNTATGQNSLYNNTKGGSNIAAGLQALYSNTTANKNIAIGHDALYTQSFSNADAVWDSDNVAIGYQALYLNQPTSTANGRKNIALGNYALKANTFGKENTAIGYNSLFSNTTGNYSTASGLNVLYSNTTGSENTASGLEALYSNTTGNNNTASGVQALYSNTTGNNNTAIGWSTGDNITTGSSNIMIGYDINAPSATGNNQLSIGNLIFGTGIDGTGTTISSGNVGIGTTSPVANLEIRGPDSTDTKLILTAYNNSAIGNSFIGRYAEGTLSSPSAVTGGDILALFGANGYTGSNFSSGDPKASIKMVADSLWDDSGNNPTRIQFFTTPQVIATPVERMRIDSAGNVGIGTTSPSYNLHLLAADTDEIRVEVTGTGPSTGSRLTLKTPTNETILSQTLEGAGILGTTTATSLRIITDNTNRMFFEETGDIGIGTTNPGSKLSIVGLSTTNPGISAGMVCITTVGDLWIDDGPVFNCDHTD